MQRLRRFGKGVFSVTVSESQALFHAKMHFFEISYFGCIFSGLVKFVFKTTTLSATLLLRRGMRPILAESHVE